jgi:hypothetical protein
MKTVEKIGKRFEIMFEPEGFGPLPKGEGKTSRRPYAVMERRTHNFLRDELDRVRTFGSPEKAKAAIAA